MIQQRHAGVAVRPHHQTRKPAEKFVRNQGSAIIVNNSELIKTSWTLNSPCLHIVIVIADGGGVEEGGHSDEHRHWPDTGHEQASEGAREVRVPGPGYGHVPTVISLCYIN